MPPYLNLILILSVLIQPYDFKDLLLLGPVLCCMLYPFPFKVHVFQPSCHGSSPGCFGTSFPSSGPSHCDISDCRSQQGIQRICASTLPRVITIAPQPKPLHWCFLITRMFSLYLFISPIICFGVFEVTNMARTFKSILCN